MTKLNSDTGTIHRPEYYFPVIDTESLLFSLLKQRKWGLNTPSQERLVAGGKESDKNHVYCECKKNCENCCTTECKEKSSTANDNSKSAITVKKSLSSRRNSKNKITSTAAEKSRNKCITRRDIEIVFRTLKSFKQTSINHNTGKSKIKLHSVFIAASVCSVNLKAIRMSQQKQQLPSSPALLRQHRSATMSSTSSLSSEYGGSSSNSKTRRKMVSRLAKRLKDDCDKILASSESFVIDWRLLSAALKEIHKAESRFGVEDASTRSEDSEYQDLVMFLADLFKFTPTLGITGTVEAKSPSSHIGSIASTIDLSHFHNIKFLELKKVSPMILSNLKMVKRSLTLMKCTRSVNSIEQILTEPLMNEAGVNKKLSCMWPEISHLDLKDNQIETIDSLAVESLELCPLIETLNLSRNRISFIDDSFSRINSLSIINISYNMLTVIPPVPPNVKVLLLAHNYITTLANKQNSNRKESFISQGPYGKLETLDLSSNMIDKDCHLRVLRNIPGLKHASFDDNPIAYGKNYRTTVLSYLHKQAINRHFTLDNKRFTSTEVTIAISKIKYVPHFATVPSTSRSPMSTSLVMTSSATSSSRPSPLSHITSLTQSFDSNSSSLRSSRRKKPKIREISTIDFNESYNENVTPSDNESIARVPMERPGSSLSMLDRKSILTDNGLEQTCATIKALRDKYGADNWLLQQHPGRNEVSKIISIPEHKPFVEFNPSRSLPSHPERRSMGRRNSCSRCEGFNNNGNDSNEKTSSDGISVLASHNTSSVDGSDVGSYTDVYSRHFKSKQYSSSSGDSNGVDGAKHTDSSSGAVASSSITEEAVKSSIFDINSDYSDEKFPTESENCEYFRIFMQGQYHNLICFNEFLFEVDPHDSTIYNKWDLNSLISLEEEKVDSETETVEFRLKFNTMRKQMREKSFIMCAKEFSKFDKMVSPYIEKQMMEEFFEALQCTRCHAQFSKAMASKTVKHEKGKAPREILVCPDAACGNEFLVTLDTIPLPNNECLEVDRGSLENSIPVPLRTSTPSVDKTASRSVPKNRSPPILEAIKNFASSFTSRKSVNSPSRPVIQQNSSFDEKSDCVSDTKTTTTSSSDTAMHTKSDSDIEVLSYESSSIEILHKCGDSESDEVEVPEAEEVPVPEFQQTKEKGPMSESTSSGSCAESIVTQYERKLQLHPISQPFATPTVSPSISSSLSSYTSNSTLTSGSLNSPQKTASSTIPVRYDFVDFSKVDHRLQLWAELSVLKSADENILAVVKCLIVTDNANMLGIVIFSSAKIYLYKITGTEGDKPQEWLTKWNTYDISKFTRLDVLIGRHGVGVDLSGKYFAMIFRDSDRASSFLEFFMSEICGQLERPPMVRDLSQTQKALMCPTSPLAYFGIVRFAVCDIEHSYPVSAIVLTHEDIILVTDVSWMAAKNSEKVLAKHCKAVSTLRQIESLESDPTLVRLIYDNAKWELLFETDHEKDTFMSIVKSDLQISVPTITICSPIEP